jgi:hypothetical protein
MGDSWEYTVLWEYAGLTPPDFHEDEINAIIDTLIAIESAIGTGSSDVWGELNNVKNSGISSAAFDSLYESWNTGGNRALEDLRNTIGGLRNALSEALVDIYSWKIRVVEVLGALDVGLTAYYVGTLGLGALLNHAKADVLEAELKRRLQALVAELEGKLISMAINGTPLSALQSHIADQLQKVVTSAVDDAGRAAGNYVRNT